MTIQTYQTEREKSIRYRDTLNRHFRDAFSALEDQVMAGGYVDFSRLANDNTYTRAVNAYKTAVTTNMQNFFGAAPTNDPIKNTRLMIGYCGTSLNELVSGIGKIRDNMSFGAYNDIMMQYIMNASEEVKQSLAVPELKPNHAQNVINYTNTDGRVDLNKLAANPIAMAMLVDSYDFGGNNVSNDLIGKLRVGTR